MSIEYIYEHDISANSDDESASLSSADGVNEQQPKIAIVNEGKEQTILQNQILANNLALTSGSMDFCVGKIYF